MAAQAQLRGVPLRALPRGLLPLHPTVPIPPPWLSGNPDLSLRPSLGGSEAWNRTPQSPAGPGSQAGGPWARQALPTLPCPSSGVCSFFCCARRHLAPFLPAAPCPPPASPHPLPLPLANTQAGMRVSCSGPDLAPPKALASSFSPCSPHSAQEHWTCCGSERVGGRASSRGADGAQAWAPSLACAQHRHRVRPPLQPVTCPAGQAWSRASALKSSGFRDCP